MKVDVLRRAGVNIGKGTVFFDAGNITVDSSRPELLSIGQYCKITGGTVILTHDYSRSVLRRVYGDIVGEARCTEIGNNVFIGMNSIILMGAKIGDNSIVGAGSVCHGQYPANSVITGNPARVIMSLDDYYKKRKSVYADEAQILAEAHLVRYGKVPSIQEMGAFFPLYLERNIDEVKRNNLRTNLSGDVEEEVIASFMKSKPLYISYDEFLKLNHIGEKL
jgi:carbonic anhydrase/acetyltransferase-like protein (isoleucine patch superfamily)